MLVPDANAKEDVGDENGQNRHQHLKVVAISSSTTVINIDVAHYNHDHYNLYVLH